MSSNNNSSSSNSGSTNNKSEFDKQNTTILEDLAIQNHNYVTIINIAVKINGLILNDNINNSILLNFFDKIIKLSELPDYHGNISKIYSDFNVKKVIKYIFTNNLIKTGEHMIWINTLRKYLYILNILLECPNCKLNQTETNHLLNIFVNHVYYKHNTTQLINFVDNSNICDCNQVSLELASKYECCKFIAKCIEKRIKISDTCLLNIIKIDNCDLFKLAISTGINLEKSFLNLACGYGSLTIIKYLLDNKIEPTKDSFEHAAFYNDPDQHYNYNYNNNRKNVLPNREKNKKMINILKSYGYRITYDDVVFATRQKIIIDDFETLNIKLNTEFMEICTELNFYPYKMTGVKPTLICLEKECSKSGNLTTIRKLINQGIDPTQKCIQNACNVKNNINVISFLVSKGLKIDETCVRNVVKQLGSNLLTYTIDEFLDEKKLKNEKNVKVNDNKNNKNNTNMSDSENLVDFANSDKSDKFDNSDNSDNSVNSVNSKEEPVQKVTRSKTNTNSTTTATKTSKTKIVKKESDHSDQSDHSNKSDDLEEEEHLVKKVSKTAKTGKTKVVKKDSDEQQQPQLVKNKVNKKVSTKPSVSEDSEDSEDETLVKKVKVSKKVVPSKSAKSAKSAKSTKSDISDISNIPTGLTKSSEPINVFCDPPENYNYRVEREIDPKVLNLFGLKNKSTHSFVSIRKYLYQYLIKNKMTKNDSIKLNKELASIIHKSESDVFETKDIEKITYSLVKNAKEVSIELVK